MFMGKNSGKSGWKPVENKPYAKAMGELRRSNASGVHADRRTKRARSRADAKRKAIGWGS